MKATVWPTPKQVKFHEAQEEDKLHNPTAASVDEHRDDRESDFDFGHVTALASAVRKSSQSPAKREEVCAHLAELRQLLDTRTKIVELEEDSNAASEALESLVEASVALLRTGRRGFYAAVAALTSAHSCLAAVAAHQDIALAEKSWDARREALLRALALARATAGRLPSLRKAGRRCSCSSSASPRSSSA